MSLVKTKIPPNWQQVKLGDLFEFKNGLNKGKEFFGHGTPIVNYTDVYKKTLLVNSDIKGLVEVSQNEVTNNSAKQNDVFFTRTSETLEEIGLSAVLLDEIDSCVFSGYILRARPITNKLYPKYSGYSLRAPYIRKDIKRKSSMTTRALTTGKFLSQVDFLLPPLLEQHRIVVILETWDNAIDLLKKKITLKKEVKKGLMQRLLSGEARLPGFGGEWKMVKLEDIGSIRTSSVDKKNVEGQKEVGLLNYMDVYRRDHIQQKDNFQIVTAKENQIFSSNLKQGDVLFTPSSETPSDIGHSAVVMEDLDNIVFSYHLVRFRPKKGVLDPAFSAYCFKTFEFYKKLWRKAQGATRFTLSKDAIGKSSIIISESHKEQQAIASILTTADKEITLLEQKLHALEQQNKFLLNNLVTGEIRTPEDLLVHA